MYTLIDFGHVSCEIFVVMEENADVSSPEEPENEVVARLPIEYFPGGAYSQCTCYCHRVQNNEEETAHSSNCPTYGKYFNHQQM